MSSTAESLHFIITPKSFTLDTDTDAQTAAGAPDTADSIKVIGEKSDKNPGSAADWSERFLTDRFDALYQMGYLDRFEEFSPSCAFLYDVADAFIAELMRLPDLKTLREKARGIPDAAAAEALIANVPFIPGWEYVTESWLLSVWERLGEVYEREMRAFEGGVDLYFAEKNQNLRVPGCIFFHLVENKNDTYPFAFMATYSPENGTKHVPLKFALTEYQDDGKRLLRLLGGLTRAAEASGWIASLMASGELFYPLKLTASEAYTYLTEIPLYEEAGILCRMPAWWKRKSSRIRVTLSVGEKQPSRVGFDAIVSMVPRITSGGETVTPEEIKLLLAESEGLAFFKGKWVEVNHEKLRAALKTCEQLQKQADGMTLMDALRASMRPERFLLDAGPEGIEIDNGTWLRSVRKALSDPAFAPSVEVPVSFRAQLRPYQHTGVRWLCMHRSLGFGACLADDMGLGKTIQTLAYLEYIRVREGGRAVIVAPTSLLGNWAREIKRFAPEMPFAVAHGAEAQAALESGAFLTLTSYGMASRIETLKDTVWDALVLDEAQNIKNPSAAQTKAVKRLRAKSKIILTGTPVENRSSDLWSLFDFINPGLLGTASEFKEYTKKLISSQDGYRRLRNTVSPFLLRRLKTNKAIVAELPDKTEISEYIPLSKKQAALYEKMILLLKNSLVGTEGIDRKGAVLAALTKFKQLCNHPDQYLGQTEYREDQSGKFIRLRELCETIRDKRERVIVFTQYREIIDPLDHFLSEIFGQRGLVLHGGVPEKKRTERVEAFNAEQYTPYMVLSLKAGGVGLNLTAANHVIHFDRWWNPAVENQATDRAFRIGQTRDVMVHKFVSSGTVEEKIELIIEDKKKLSGDIVGGGGEMWITEMSNDELMKLFRLEA